MKTSTTYLLLFLSAQILNGTSPIPTSFWECSLWATIEDEEWLANSCGKFRIEHESKIEGSQTFKAWIHHNHHGWVWIESADLSNLWWYSESLKWTTIPNFGYPYIYSEAYGWLYYLQGSSQPRWFFNYSEKEWKSYSLGYTPTDYFTKQRSPEPVDLVAPKYPSGFYPVDEDGVDTYGITFHFLVDRNGTVQKPRVFVLNTVLAERDDVINAAQRALEASEFLPGIRNNKPATLHYRHRYYVKKTD